MQNLPEKQAENSALSMNFYTKNLTKILTTQINPKTSRIMQYYHQISRSWAAQLATSKQDGKQDKNRTKTSKNRTGKQVKIT